MIDFATARQNMVDCQVRPNDVTDVRIHEAMGRIPREQFVPKSKQKVAYSDVSMQLRDGRLLMEPRCFAKLLQAADIGPEDLVLDVGCGPGYSTAVIAALAGAVVAIDSNEDFVATASEHLQETDVDNAAVVHRALDTGCPDQGPYDVIFINGAVETVPQALLDQLKEGGRLVTVFVGETGSHARLYTKSSSSGDAAVCGHREVFDAAIPVLSEFARPKVFEF